MTDFRTATTERRVQNRLAYLETLASAPGLGEEERAKLTTAMAEHQAVLDALKEEASQGHRVSSILPLPVQQEHAGIEEFHTYPVYVPPIRVMQKWKVEAKLGQDAYGDQRDEHRRVLVMIEVVEDLLRILAEEEVKLTPLPKPAEEIMAPDEFKPVVAESTDLAPA